MSFLRWRCRALLAPDLLIDDFLLHIEPDLSRLLIGASRLKRRSIHLSDRTILSGKAIFPL